MVAVLEVVVVVALLQPPSWQMHFDPRPGVQSAVGGANIFVCLSVGVCAVCLCVCVPSCVCAVCHHEECHPRGGSPYKCSQYNISRSPRRDSTRIWIRLQIRNKVSARILLGISFKKPVACFPEEHTSSFVSLARVFCPYLTIAPAWKRFPGARNKSYSVSRLSFEMVLAEGRRPVISQFSC